MVVRADGAVTVPGDLAGPGGPAGLLARWGIPADAELARAERGCNNRTYAVAHRGHRWVLRISQNLSAAQARAEHGLLGRTNDHPDRMDQASLTCARRGTRVVGS